MGDKKEFAFCWNDVGIFGSNLRWFTPSAYASDRAVFPAAINKKQLTIRELPLGSYFVGKTCYIKSSNQVFMVLYYYKCNKKFEKIKIIFVTNVIIIHRKL